MKIEILQEAEEELTESIGFYEEIEPGPGLRLKEEVSHTIQWIAGKPFLPRLRSQGYRRVNLKIFRHYVANFIRIGSDTPKLASACGTVRMRNGKSLHPQES